MSDESQHSAQSLQFQKLVETWHSPLFRFALSLTANEIDAADLTQDTFLIWATKGDTLRDPAKAKSWLFTTLYREFLRQRKRAARLAPCDPEVLEFIAPSIPAQQIREMDANLAVEALQEVDIIFREPLALFYLESFSYQEIADTLEIPLGTVMSRLSRGKDQLKQRILRKRAGIKPIQ